MYICVCTPSCTGYHTHKRIQWLHTHTSPPYCGHPPTHKHQPPHHTIGVMFGANWLQQLVVRKIGAPLMSMFCPSTLVAATVGSYYFLDEKLTNAFQFGGLVVVSLAICVFLMIQMRVR